MMWESLDTWTVVVGALAGLACAVPGCFLVLRRLSMMGDALSHAVLPGLAIAFLISGSRDSVPMLLGAVVVGLVAAALIHAVQRHGGLEEGAAMGVVFTSLFAGGLILIRRAADHVDLDPGCVLYGSLELAVLDSIPIAGVEVPRAALLNGGVFLFNLLLVLLLYKEMKICAFDPGHAQALGIPAGVMHYLLMAITALTCVAAFESVGSILVIAMLIVPAATAQLLTSRLSAMLWVAGIVAVLSAALGHLGALTVPRWFGFGATTSAGMIATAAGVLFALAFGWTATRRALAPMSETRP